MTNRNSINVSFPEEETKLYKDILLESSYTDIPVAALSRKYMKLGMQCTKRKSLTSGGVWKMYKQVKVRNLIYEMLIEAAKKNRKTPEILIEHLIETAYNAKKPLF